MTSTQSEDSLEQDLVKQLSSDLGYEKVDIRDEAGLLTNLKSQLEKHNNTVFSDQEFQRILNHLNKGNVFERAKILRDKMGLTRDDESTKFIEFMNVHEWCQNEYQVTRQVSQEGNYTNRYDVTLLVNGLPLVQIELKRRGLELKEAFNQINRYQRHSFWANSGLFQYVQIFVISNGVNTKYFANNRKQEFKQTFYWSDEKNTKITALEDFARAFLEKCHLSKMIAKYIVLNETDKILMVLRPYQYYAVEAIVEHVKHSPKNGYIWHTTGSGKTLTSFKASQIIKALPQVHKVLFVVDRKDLDYQTNKEFNAFSKGSVDGTSDTKALVKQLGDDTKLIVTTLQKLNTAITNPRYEKAMTGLKDQKVVFIFDECHRSQFGDTHKRITEYFNDYQMFGFTGTPIFKPNAAKNEHGQRGTEDLFDVELHNYVITNAIADENVLKFCVEYVGRYKQKDDSANAIDINVEDIDTKELMESPKRLEAITDYILAHHGAKTHYRSFTAMMCVSNIDMLCQYYDLFAAKKAAGDHKLNIATIFSYTANEDDKDANGQLDNIDPLDNSKGVNEHSRDRLERYIADYNQMFGSKFTTKDSKSFYNYYNDIAKKVKEGKIDILLVVNMFLTGFDSKKLNTLYVDKNLKYHGLLQAFSRTNRILGEVKSQGNIVCFRNLKQATDDAISLFSDLSAKDQIIMQPFGDYVAEFKEAVETLHDIVPTISDVDRLMGEDQELAFVKAFRNVMRLKNILVSFSDYDEDKIAMGEQEFADYSSKYLDLRDKVKNNFSKDKVSILEDVDFELELIHRDEINVSYILQLLGQLKEAEGEEQDKQRKKILDAVSASPEMRSKKELIEKFILQNLPDVPSAAAVPDSFKAFWTQEQEAAFTALCQEENLDADKVTQIIQRYSFNGRKPMGDSIIQAMQSQPKILERKTLAQRALDRIMGFIDIFCTDRPD